MTKKIKISFGILLIFLLFVFATGCDLIKRDKGSNDNTDFEMGSSGLVMEFVPNYPGNNYMVSGGASNDAETEPIFIMIDVRNKGTYSLGEGSVDDTPVGRDVPTFEEFLEKEVKVLADEYEKYANQRANQGKTFEEFFEAKFKLTLREFLTFGDSPPGEEIDPELYDLYLSASQIYLKKYPGVSEGSALGGGRIYLSGFDTRIIDIKDKSENLESKYLPAASPINPLGGFDTVEFEGRIVAKDVTIDEYNPTILATACYPYATKASPTVCIDPQPFDDRQEKVCNIGSQTLETQGAPITVTRIDQEASTTKMQFKITIENVGGGDVLKPGDDTLEKCNPLEGGSLDRKDFDRVQLTKVEVGGVDLFEKGKCSPFADGSDNLVRLFDGEGFVICTLDMSMLGGAQSAYTTPLNIKLIYNYRSTISKSIRISKLTSIG